MPTVIQAIRSDNSYIGFAQEASAGTPVAPIWFPRWVDLSIEYDLKVEEVMEGDGTRHVSQLVKNQQMVKIKYKCYPRMNELGAIEKQVMGTGSDTITTATPTTTSNTVVTGGTSTTIGLVSGTGFFSAGLGNFQLLVGTGTVADPYETVLFNVPATLGTTLTVASTYNGGKFKQSHPSGTTVSSIATANTSFTSAATAGATTIVVGNNNGLAGAGTAVLVLSPGTANEENVTVTTPGTGTGPYTYTLANSATTKFAHSIADNVSSPVIHVLTDQSDGDYWTYEVGLGNLNGAAGTALRVRDCKVELCKESGKAGGIHCYEVEVTGIASSVQGTPATITLEQHSLFLYTQGTWTVDGATTGDALNIGSFEIDHKNNLDTGIQTEQLTNAAIIFGKVNVDLKFEIFYITPNRTYLVYFGGTSGTTDSQVIGAGSWNVAFLQPDGFQQVAYNLATTHYKKIGLPAPKSDGKAYKQAVEAVSVSNAGANTFVRKVTVYNTQYSVY